MAGIESAETRRLRGRAAVAVKLGKSNAEELRRDYATAKLADYVRRVVDSAPPLTPEQRAKIASLLAKGDCSPGDTHD